MFAVMGAWDLAGKLMAVHPLLGMAFAAAAALAGGMALAAAFDALARRAGSP
jgi:hypothetical protein